MSKKLRVLTGITTTGIPHLGNYVGAIRPAIAASHNDNTESFFFLANYHALIKCHEPEKIKESTKAIAATWMALGLDTDKTVFYRQSDVPEIMELCWILTCMTGKGLMNRAHAYKAAVQDNNDSGTEDLDKGVTMGLFSYPILMAADILMFNAHRVPVGKDQIQHVEMARDIAQRFNHYYGEHFVLPEAVVNEEGAVLAGLDGRKMSKSYGNTIALFEGEKKLKKSINKIKTNLKEPGEPKQTDESSIFQLYEAFANKQQASAMAQQLADGIGWGEAKKITFEQVNAELAQAREKYNALMDDGAHIEAVLQAGAVKARQHVIPRMQAIRKAVGITPIQ